MLRIRANLTGFPGGFLTGWAVYWVAELNDQEESIMRLGSSLYHARKKSGLTQEDVAEKLGVSRQTISKWETEVSQS